MSYLPLESERLLLRPYLQEDAPEIARLLDDPEMARFLMVIPHPFVEFDARQLVKAAWRRLTAGRGLDLLVTLKADGHPIGSVGIGLHDEGKRGELGFWVGREYWGRGYASEAARRIVDFAIERLGVERFAGTAAADNPRSLAVLAELGFKETGRGRKRVPSTGEMREMILLERDSRGR